MRSNECLYSKHYTKCNAYDKCTEVNVVPVVLCTSALLG